MGRGSYKTSYKTAIGFEQADRYLRLIVVAFEVSVCLVSSDVGGAVSAIIVDVVIPGYNVCGRAPEVGVILKCFNFLSGMVCSVYTLRMHRQRSTAWKSGGVQLYPTRQARTHNTTAAAARYRDVDMMNLYVKLSNGSDRV